MAQQQPRLSIETEATHTHVILLDEEILHELQIRQIQTELDAALAPTGAIRLVLDFGRVVRLSSMALGMLTVLHKHILERGDSSDPAELYRNFMGRNPSLDALLRRSGLTCALSTTDTS